MRTRCFPSQQVAITPLRSAPSEIAHGVNLKVHSHTTATVNTTFAFLHYPRPILYSLNSLNSPLQRVSYKQTSYVPTY
jgi:hypothetical protein